MCHSRCKVAQWTISTMSFSYGFVMSQNKMTADSVQETLGKIVVYYDNLYKIKKRAKVAYIPYKIHMSILLYAFKIFGLFAVRNHFTSLQGIYYSLYCY